MFLVEFLRFVTGYAEFTGTGGFSERFINLCSVHEIPLWNVAFHDGYFTARTTIDGYFRIPVCARNSGVKIKKTRSVGMPFVLKRLKPRAGLAIGAIFFVVCLSLLSNRVWLVDISGNGDIAKDVILSATQQAGLTIGKKTNELNVVQVSLNTCEAVEGISWAAIRVNGCCVYIDITPASEAPGIEQKNGAYNIVSSKDAQLIILEAYKGTRQAKVFNPVLKGDILISGFTVNKDESVSFVHASGYAVGRTETEISSSVSTNISCNKYTHFKSTCFLHFFGITIPVGKAPSEFSQKFEQSKMVVYDDKTLPVGITVARYYTQNAQSKKISSEQARLIAAGSFMNDFAQFSQGRQITEADVSFVKNKNCVEARGNFICYENIGIEAPFQAEETPES